VTAKSTAPTRAESTVKKSPLEQRMSANVSAERSKQSLNEYRNQQAKFKYSGSPVKSSPVVQRTVVNRVVVNNHYHYTPANYAYRQRSFYGYYGWNPPVYGYGFYPSYGLWNTVALWFMLDHIADQQYAMMYYSHRNDADMQAWRAQAEREAQNNAELRAKLAAADQRALALQQQGVQADPGYVPADMKDVALSEDVVKQQAQDPQNVQQPQQQVQQPAPVAPQKESSHWFLWTIAAIAVGAIGFAFWKL
jgi:hypothetical protein